MGYHHSMVLKKDGTVWATGWNKYGQLGDGSTIDRSNFVKVSSDAIALAAGECHSMVLKRDGTVWATGWNKNGQLGKASTIEPTFIKVSSDVIAVAAGSYHSMVLKKEGSLWATGANDNGQLGQWQAGSTKNFFKVSSDTIAIAAGSNHSMMLKADGSVWATGQNDYGQLGHGHTGKRSRYAEVFGKCDTSILHHLRTCAHMPSPCYLSHVHICCVTNWHCLFSLRPTTHRYRFGGGLCAWYECDVSRVCMTLGYSRRGCF